MRPSQAAVAGALASTGRDRRSGPPRGMGREWTEALTRVPLFANVPRRHLGRIVRLAREVRLRQGATVVLRTQVGRELYVILEGSAVVLTRSGGEVGLGPGDFFGEMAVIDGRPRSAAVRAETDLVLMALGRPQFLKLLRGEPSIALAVIQELTRRIRRLEGEG